MNVHNLQGSVVLIMAYKNIRALDANMDQGDHEKSKVICLGVIALKSKFIKAKDTM